MLQSEKPTISMITVCADDLNSRRVDESTELILSTGSALRTFSKNCSATFFTFGWSTGFGFDGDRPESRRPTLPSCFIVYRIVARARRAWLRGVGVSSSGPPPSSRSPLARRKPSSSRKSSASSGLSSSRRDDDSSRSDSRPSSTSSTSDCEWCSWLLRPAWSSASISDWVSEPPVEPDAG